MPKIVGILTFISRKNLVLSYVEHVKSFITSGPGWYQLKTVIFSFLDENICSVALDAKQQVFQVRGRKY